MTTTAMTAYLETVRSFGDDTLVASIGMPEEPVMIWTGERWVQEQHGRQSAGMTYADLAQDAGVRRVLCDDGELIEFAEDYSTYTVVETIDFEAEVSARGSW